MSELCPWPLPLRGRCADTVADAISYLHEVGFDLFLGSSKRKLKLETIIFHLFYYLCSTFFCRLLTMKCM